MNIGISTATFYPQETEGALAQVAALGAGHCEVFLNSFCELERPFLQALRLTALRHGMEIVSLHPFTSSMEPLSFFSAYPRRVQDGIALYRRFFEAASFLGAKYVIFHGDSRQNPFPEEEGFRHLALLCQAAADYGVALSHENVARCKGREPGYLSRLAKAVPELSFTLDVKQAVRAGEDPFSFLEALKDRVGHIHISDHLPGRDCLPPGEGNFNFFDFFRQLRAMGYRGALVIELYRHNFDTPEDLLKSYNFLRTFL